MFKILDRYIEKTILKTIMITLFILLSLSGIIKFVEQLHKVGQEGYSTLSAGLFTLFSIPKDIEMFFPMAVLLGGLLGLGSLAIRNELVVMQASGFSHLQIAGAVMKTTIQLMFLTIAINEWIAPASEKITSSNYSKPISINSMLSVEHGLWAKDGNDFIFIKRIVNNNELTGVNIYHFNDTKQLQSLIYAAKAIFHNGSWKLSQVNESNLTNDQEITSQQTTHSEWKTNLTPDKLLIVTLRPNSLSISGLKNYINYLKRSGQEYNRYQLNMWSKIFSPFSVAVMMLISLSCIFGPLRGVSIGILLITGLSFGFLFYILNQIFRPLSLLYNIPPILGALFPSIIFLIVSILMLLKRE